MSACPMPVVIGRLCAKPGCDAEVMGKYAIFCYEHACEKRRRARKYLRSAEVDQVIREAYEAWRTRGDRKAIKLAAKRIEWPRWMVKLRARQLGLTRVKESPWSNTELAILDQFGWMQPETLAVKLRERGFQRSVSGITQMRTRQMAGANGAWFTARGLAKLLGIDDHKVLRWIRAGLLPARRRGTNRTEAQGGDDWLIMRTAVRQFLIEHPVEYDLDKVDKYWFIDLLARAKDLR